MSAITTGELARRADVNVETLRYYERRGLLRVPSRRASGYRQYAAADVTRVQAIRLAQSLGFTLKEIGELLSALEEPGQRCSRLKRRAEQKIAQIAHKIEELEQARSALEELVGGCTGTRQCRSTVAILGTPES